MRSGDMVAAALLWEEAELGHSENLQIFGLILPRLTFFLDTLSRHGFNNDPTKLNEEELAMVQRIGQAAVDLGQAGSYGRNLGELGTKVVAEALTTNSVTHFLDLDANNMGDAGARALAESLKINVTLISLYLEKNNIGPAGAEALAESLKINVTLEHLSLGNNNIGAAGAHALGESLKINTTLRCLALKDNNIGTAGALALAAGLLQNRGLETLALSPGCGGDEGRQALEDAKKTKTERGEDFEIIWF